MKNEIKVSASPSEISDRTFTIDLLEMGYTKDYFDGLDEQDKERIIQEYLDNAAEQPYWIFNGIKN